MRGGDGKHSMSFINRPLIRSILLILLVDQAGGAIPTRVVDVDISNAHGEVVDIDLGSGKQTNKPADTGLPIGGEVVDLGSILSLLFGGDISVPSGGNVIEVNLDQPPVQHPEPAESFIIFGMPPEINVRSKFDQETQVDPHEVLTSYAP
ncbi:hypothetical protein GUITHDRAFT_140563 [Guillardia theta CCMP2712]|uniref:Uncharacterized protein n=1 Tax=Guillardia theta (strain CCMP2712) TaxID=905079 RepID=L1J580_GUITC|nr:hypothetical protein GUITHDRAFT_140563 [Guillardia theta CCMP2712]EKX43240.1 hypothetical protein GUITHDRAFT_140563 [Guillardia theta CCMP2712]|eukprot:XP_005830220.1 hypothetical protein GUITHDRAFT_140563 [Guillardia theta CCMP2712]